MFFRRVRLKFFVIAISHLHDLVTMVIYLPSPLPLSFSPACLQAMYPYSEQGSGWSASLGSCSYSPLQRQIFQPTISPETEEATLNTSDLFLPYETPFFGPLLSVLHDKGCEFWFDRCIFGLCPVFLQNDLHPMTSRLAAPTLVATQYTVRSGQLSWSSRRMVSKWSSKSFLTWGLVANNNFCRVCYRFCEV